MCFTISIQINFQFNLVLTSIRKSGRSKKEPERFKDNETTGKGKQKEEQGASQTTIKSAKNRGGKK